MKRLSVNHIKQMHRLIIAETGGSSGVRSEELLDSAVNLPFQTFDGVPLYKTVESKAAILGINANLKLSH
ncbi:MAG: Fic family protein [Anaerovoracaceae bacterium]|jgi:death-on-curing protein